MRAIFNAITITILSAALFALAPVGVENARAQFGGASAFAVSLQSTPDTPGPNERVVVELSSFSLDLSRAAISWFLDGKLASSAVGKTRFVFTTRGLGTPSRVSVSVQAGTLNIIKQSAVFIPSEVDLVWKTVGAYTPPFYKGKALSASQSVIRVTALPHLIAANGNELAPETLIYKWKRNNRYRDFNKQSGYGKNSIVFQKNLLRPGETISVEVSSANDSLRGRAEMITAQYNPQVILYEENPLLGILYGHALGETFIMKDKELTLVAEPYYFSTGNRDGSLINFNWFLNNKELPPEENGKGAVTFRVGEESGVSRVTLAVKHTTRFLQFVNQAVSLNFGQ